MWQRIQTVFLIIAILSLLISLVQPIWIFDSGEDLYVLTSFYFLKEDTYQYFPYSLTSILTVASATVSFIEIRKYKNRMVQVKLGALNSLFMAGTMVAAFFFSNSMLKTYQAGQYGLGLWLPGVAVICNLLANQFIRRDEKLVKDSDRLR